jgi:hypothetical protein
MKVAAGEIALNEDELVDCDPPGQIEVAVAVVDQSVGVDAVEPGRALPAIPGAAPIREASKPKL